VLRRDRSVGNVAGAQLGRIHAPGTLLATMLQRHLARDDFGVCE
jgi:hypothetical protein